MWFWLAIIALLCWSGSDLFSKIGCRDGRDKYNPLKMVIAVGVVMGIHAAYEIFIGGAVVTWSVIWTYLPVSLLYIGSMTLGYVGLRYIELSISSPICNSSGALVAVLCLLTGTLDESITGAMRYLVIGAVALVCIGVVGLGVVESTEDDELRRKRQEGSNYKYAKSWLALCLPIAYCLLDAAGTFADSLVLRTLDEDSANCAYELTFLAAAVICFIYVVVIKKDKLVFKAEAPKYAGALFLDEIGTMSYEIQSLLLRVLQENTYASVGGRERTADVRIIAATNEDMQLAIREGRFREDLYHRLNEFEIRQPSLAECPEDILPLAEFFRERHSKELKRETQGFTDDARRRMLAYHWPGNVRELQNRIKRAVLVTETPMLNMEALDMEIRPSVNDDAPSRAVLPLRDESMEKESIINALKVCNGHREQAAAMLNINPATLYRKMKKYGLK